MKTNINNTAILRILVLFSMSTGYFFTSSCKKDSSSGTPESTSIKTYSGTVAVTESYYQYNDLIDLSFAAGSTKNGTFFRKGNGEVGTFSGTTSGGILSINGTMDDNPALVFSGTIKIESDSLLFNISGTGYSDNYIYTGTLHLADCINLVGNYYVHDSVSYTISMGGETQEDSQNGSGYILLNQIDCHVSYDVPGTIVTRDGEIDGNKLVLTGPFIIPASSDVHITENTFKATVLIIDNYHFKYTGTGNAKGTYLGSAFVIKGTSKGIFDRYSKSKGSAPDGDSWWSTDQSNSVDGQTIFNPESGNTDLQTLITKRTSPKKFPWSLHSIVH